MRNRHDDDQAVPCGHHSRRIKAVGRLGVALIWLLLSCRSTAFANDCAHVEPVLGATGYQERQNSDRCEGFYKAPATGETLELLSFVNGDFSYDLSVDKILIVAVPNVGVLGARSVAVSATALPQLTYYRMDAQVASGGSMTWPLGASVAPADLQADDIGILGRIGQGTTAVFIPVSVFVKGQSSTAKATSFIVIRSSTDVEKVRWQLTPENARDGSAPVHRLAAPDDTLRDGEPVRIPIRRTASIQRFDLYGRRADTDELVVLPLRIFNPP